VRFILFYCPKYDWNQQFAGNPAINRTLIIAGLVLYMMLLGEAMTSTTSVLTTVNAPYSKKLTAQELLYCLLDPEAAKNVPGHMSSFFGEVKPELQSEFAAQFNLDQAQLVAAAKAFSSYSGELYPIAA